MEEILGEWAAEEAWNEELGGALEFLSPLRLPRLRGKQPPVGDWRRVGPGFLGRAVEEAAHEEEGEEPEEPVDVERLEAEAEGEAENKKERPKKRARTEFCPGRSRARPCMFSQKPDHWGQAAMLDKGKARCQFCDAKALAEAIKAPQRKKHITLALRKWQDAGRQAIFDAALALIPEDARADFLQALKRPSRAAPAVEARAKAKAEADKEERRKALEQRQWLGGAFSHEEHRVYR